MAPSTSTGGSAGRPSAKPSVGGYVVLGLLLDAPASGWDLTQAVERSIGHFWPITKAHIYAELPKLARRGWVVSTDVRQSGAPDKRVYQATEEGEIAFADWLEHTELIEERGRQPLQLQFFFAAHAAPGRIDMLLDVWEQRAEDAEAHCQKILRSKGVDTDRLPRITPEGTNMLAGREVLGTLDARGMTALYGLRRAQADLVWVAEVRNSRLITDSSHGDADSVAR